MMRWLVLGLLVGCGDKDPVETDDPATEPATTGACEGVPESACAEVEGCVAITGTPINGAAQFAGCATEGPCTDAESASIAPDGTCWDFVDGCLPDGWTPLGGDCVSQL